MTAGPTFTGGVRGWWCEGDGGGGCVPHTSTCTTHYTHTSTHTPGRTLVFSFYHGEFCRADNGVALSFFEFYWLGASVHTFLKLRSDLFDRERVKAFVTPDLRSRTITPTFEGAIIVYVAVTAHAPRCPRVHCHRGWRPFAHFHLWRVV